MNIEALRTLIYTADHRNYHKVAQLMRVSQPAISKRIRVLEDQLQQRLVERVGASMVLTPAGQAFLPYCNRIVETYDEARSRLGNPADWQGTIRLGAVDTILSTWLADFLDSHQAAFPRARIDVIAAPTRDLLEDLSNGRIDLAIMLGPSYDRALIEIPLCVMDVGFFEASAHPIRPDAPPRRLGADEIAKANIITFPRDSHPHLEMVERLRQLDLPYQPSVRGCTSLFTMRSMGERGLGIITLPTATVGSAHLAALDLGIEPIRLSFAASYVPSTAPDIYAATCRLAQKTAASYALRNPTGIRAHVEA